MKTMKMRMKLTTTMTQIFKVCLPLSVNVSSKKKFIFNINNYRNGHFFVLNKAKQLLKEFIQPQLINIPKLNKIRLRYTLFKNDNRKCDVNNICTVADKFFCDALVEAGKLEDDNYDYLPLSVFRWGGIDKDNPRIEVEIKDISK